MTSLAASTPPAVFRRGDAGLSIGQVSRLLAVPIPTMRSWERRYAIPSFSHDNGRHRRYTAHDLHAVRLMSHQIAGGKRAREAARDVHSLLAQTGPAVHFVEQLLTVGRDPGGSRMRSLLSQAREELGLAACIDEVVVALMQQVGSGPLAGCRSPRESATVAGVQGWLRRAALTAAPVWHQSIVLMAAPGDAHTIGLDALATLLAVRGYSAQVVPVGLAAVPTAGLPGSPAAAAVVVGCQLSTSRRRAIDVIASARHAGATVFCAGSAFHGSTRRAAGATYLGTRISAAADIIDVALTASNTAKPRRIGLARLS